LPAREDEEPVPQVRGTDFLRREHACRNAVAHFRKVVVDLLEAHTKVVGDVLEEAPAGLALPHDAGDGGPQVPGVLVPEALAGQAERLTRVAASDAIHDATPRAAVEGSQIRPNRGLVQASLFHTRSQ